MSTETSTRPFQVDDRVRITDYDVMTGKTVRTHTGKIRSLKDMSDPDASDWVTLIAEVDQPYLMGKSGTLHTVALVHLIPDRTRSTWPSNQTIELLEPAPIDPAAVQVGDTVTVERPSSNDRVDGVVNDVSPEGFVLDGWGKRFRLGDDYDGMWTLTGHQPAPPTEAPQDHGPLAAHLSDRTLAKVLSRPAYDPPSPTKDAIVEAAIRWYEIRNAHAADVTPLQLFDADDALNMAVKAHHAAVQS